MSSSGSERLDKKRRFSNTRQQNKAISSLSDGLQTLDQQRFEQDLCYITGRLSTEDRDMVGVISTLMRSGALRRALMEASGGKKGKQLASTTDTIRPLRDVFMRDLLATLEPEIFEKQLLSTLSKETLTSLVCFGLNAKPTTKLPKEHPILRFEGPLKQYMEAIYNRSGKRFSMLPGKGALTQGGEPSGIFKIIGKRVQVSIVVKEPVMLEVPAMAQGDDWAIEHAWRLDAQLVSLSQSATLGLQGICKSAGVDLGPEPVSELSLDSHEVPPMLQLLLGGQAGNAPIPQAPAQKLPKGDGKVKVVVPGAGEPADAKADAT
jgi:hypothetical protein